MSEDKEAEFFEGKTNVGIWLIYILFLQSVTRAEIKNVLKALSFAC